METGHPDWIAILEGYCGIMKRSAVRKPNVHEKYSDT